MGGALESAEITCLGCGIGHYVLRTRRADGVQFYGCSEFPRCKNSLGMDAMPHLQRWTEKAREMVPAETKKRLTPQDVAMVRRVARQVERPTIRWGRIDRTNVRQVIDRIAPDFEREADMELKRMGLDMGKRINYFEDRQTRREAYDEAWDSMGSDWDD